MIKVLLESLHKDILREIMYFFNEETQFFYDLPDGHFLAVHIDEPNNYNIIENQGFWYYGNYKE